MDRSSIQSRRLPGLILFGAICLFGAAAPVKAQFGPLLNPLEAPQARSQEELDAYLEIVTSSDPHRVIDEVNQFAANYPKSELLGIAFEHEMTAYQRLNDFNGLLLAGEKSLRLEPKNVYALLTLASAIPNAVDGRPDMATLLREAQIDAQLALHELHTMYVPRAISLSEWQEMRGEMEAQAHEALGHIAVKQQNLTLAIYEFETAAFKNPVPNGSQFFRLGVAYAMAGKRESAEKALRHAASLGPAEIQKLALKELSKLSGGKPAE